MIKLRKAYKIRDHFSHGRARRTGKVKSAALDRQFSAFFLSLLLSVAVLLPPSTDAADVRQGKREDAPAVGGHAAKLDVRLAQLTDTRDRLTVFLSGEKLIDVPPAALFTVDLSNEEAVTRRVQELKDRLSGAGADEAGQPTAPGKPELKNIEGGSREERIRRIETEIARLRLAFLSLPKERREVLVAAQQAALAHSETTERLAQEQTNAQRQKDEATRSLEVAEERAKTAKTASLRDLAAQRAVLEKTRQELASLAIQWTSSLQERTRFSRETTGKLFSLAGVLARNEAPDKVRESYLQVVEIWRGLVDQAFSHASEPERYDPVPEVPAFSKELGDRLAGDPEADAYRGAYEEILRQHQSLTDLREKRFREERDSLYRLLLQSGKLRSQLLRERIRTGEVSRFPW